MFDNNSNNGNYNSKNMGQEEAQGFVRVGEDHLAVLIVSYEYEYYHHYHYH